MSVQDTQSLLQKSNRRLAASFTFLGIAIILLALTAFVYYRLKKKWHLYYLLYTIMGVLFVLVNLGILRYFVFPEFLYFSELRIYSSCYWYLLMGVFLSETIHFRENNYKLYKLFMGNQYAVFALSILAFLFLFTGNFTLLKYATYIIFIVFFVNILVLFRSVWLAFQRQEPLAKYVVLSFLPSILWGISLILNIAGLGAYLKGFDWINWIIAYEMILFGWLLIKDYVLTIESNTLLEEKIIHTEKNTNKNIESARLKERRQISDLLHDKISTDVARTMQSLDLDEVAKAREHISELGKNIRNLSHTILPVELEHGALAQAVRHHVNNLNADRSTELISFQAYDFPEHIDKSLALSLYLTLLELLQNAIKHSEAKHIRVELYCYATEYVFTVSDDGKGLATEQQYGFGLNNIAARIKDLGGEFSLSSKPNEGVNCMLIVPIENTH
jgi:signal transduction histidine kinase